MREEQGLEFGDGNNNPISGRIETEAGRGGNFLMGMVEIIKQNPGLAAAAALSALGIREILKSKQEKGA